MPFVLLAGNGFPAGKIPALRAGSRPRARAGLTLVEILISTAVTLIMIYAIVEIFQRVGSAVAQGRAAIEMSGQIRMAAHRVREDLKGLTVPVRPWPHSASAEGYFEYLEGPQRDADALPTATGDRDDVLMGTSRSVGDPWVGRFNGLALESELAEVIWWTHRDSSGNVSLHRRVLLVRPDLNTGPGGGIPGLTATPATGPTVLQTFYSANDVSVHLIPDPNNAGQLLVAANTLGDLTKRENRFAHVTTGFPFPLDVNTPGNPTSLVNLVQTGLHQGDDVILSHVQAFDIKAFDPTAQIRSDGNRALVPSDPGWGPAGPGSAIGMGAYVDLNYIGAAGTSLFSGPAHVRSQLTTIAPASVYDTWSFHYEHDGIDQDGDGVIDQGTNGLDDNNLNGPDDVLERETSPPYPVPLRGIQIKIRIDDLDSRQVREMTVVHDFLPE